MLVTIGCLTDILFSICKQVVEIDHSFPIGSERNKDLVKVNVNRGEKNHISRNRLQMKWNFNDNFYSVSIKAFVIVLH